MKALLTIVHLMATSQEADPAIFLEVHFAPQSIYKAMKVFAAVNVHRFFAQKHSFSKGMPLKVLDYGCGPVLAYDISPAAGVKAEVVLAEYDEKCRNALQDWLDGNPSAWDWTPYIKYVVCELEHKDANETKARYAESHKGYRTM